VQRTYQRTQSLFNDHAATAQQLDKSELDYRTLLAQTAAATAQRETAVRDTATVTAQIAQINDQLRRSHVRDPIDGVVLATYVKPGEFVQPGEALYRIAALDTVDIKAYVTESQLGTIRLGQSVRVTIDSAQGNRHQFTGTISWIASEAEFTPTPIQTRDERTNLVYAIKIRVPNRGGVLKIGMPADVRFGAAGAAAPPAASTGADSAPSPDSTAP
jgi:membrane fusion protein YbhG